MRERDGKLSTSTIKYLLALYELDKNGTGTRSIDIADELQLSKPSVHSVLNKQAILKLSQSDAQNAAYSVLAEKDSFELNLFT